jgi:phosphohistidine swiveling domain-containing protein
MKLKESQLFPTTLNDIQSELLKHSKDGRSDAGFRLNIALSQIGSLAMHFTHDPYENSIARPYGTREGEVADAGHAIVQLMTYVALRDIDIQDAVNAALVNLREKDFVKREALHDDVRGQIGCQGKIKGIAKVDPYMINGGIPPKGTILVTSHPFADHRLKPYAGVITDHGGTGCHAAIVAREYGIPCIVGTGNATKKIRTGDVIILDATNLDGHGIVIITGG